MKKLLFIFGLLVSCAYAQTTTTITGTIKDLTNTLVTSGKVTFTLTPNRDTTISGVARFTPTTITCLINASGLIKAQDGVSVCTLTMNTALNPPGTYYSVAVWPYNVKTSAFSFYAVLSSYDWSTVVPTPTTSPAQNFVDVFSNQTIGGNKTWSGTNTFNGSSTFAGGLTGSTLTASSGPNSFAGANSFTGTIAQSNAGLFNNTYNQYFTSAIGGCSPQSLYTSINGAFETSAITTCVAVPVGSTERQADGVTGLVDNFSASTPAVGLYGGAQAEIAGAKVWGGNFGAFDNGNATSAIYGNEIDTDIHNASSVPRGLLVTGLWTVQPTAGFGVEIGLNSAQHWPIGIQCDDGATIAPDASDACLFLRPISTSANNPSQGLFFLSRAPVSGFNGAGLNLLANGNMQFTFPSNPTGLLIVNGNIAGTTYNTASGIYETKRAVTGCSTTNVAGAVCTTTLTWGTAFADANYTVSCQGNGVGGGVPVIGAVTSKLAGSVTVQTVAVTAVIAQFATLECIAVHD